MPHRPLGRRGLPGRRLANVWTDLSWWQWALTIPLLAAYLAGYPWALEIAIVLCALLGGYFAALLRPLRPFPVQIRVAYLGLLLSGTLPGMGWIYWVPLVGTTAMVAVDYCLLLIVALDMVFLLC